MISPNVSIKFCGGSSGFICFIDSPACCIVVPFEYALINGVNDSNLQAMALGDLLKGMLCHVNLIALNPTDGFDNTGSKQDRIDAFLQILTAKKIQATVRTRRGIDIQAGCGQLAYQQSDML